MSERTRERERRRACEARVTSATQRVLWRLLPLVTASALITAPAAAQRELREVGVDLFGLSWHYDSRTYLDGGEVVRYQQTNLGAGLHVLFAGPSRHVLMLKVGGYEDSMRNVALYAGPVWQYRLVRGLHAGGGLLIVRSRSYASSLLPLPVLTYRVGPIGLSATWIPPESRFASGSFAAFGTVAFWRR